MQQIAQFFKVSEEQFVRDWCTATRRSADEAKKVYQNIQLPRRATKGSAGYDFFAPESFTLVMMRASPIWLPVDGLPRQTRPSSGLGRGLSHLPPRGEGLRKRNHHVTFHPRPLRVR